MSVLPVCVHVCVYMHEYVCECARVYVHDSVYVHACMRACMCSCHAAHCGAMVRAPILYFDQVLSFYIASIGPY